jgi:L-2,4-diaminobutyrate decarboxylase
MNGSKKDASFIAGDSLFKVIDMLRRHSTKVDVRKSASNAISCALPNNIPRALPLTGAGEEATLDFLSPLIFQQAANLDSPLALAHMDPPTPWITWATTMFNARLNQNLLHPATAPFARQAEQIVIDYLVPYFGMQGGHFCAGATLANLTALWAARDAMGVTKIVASAGAHISIAKAAKILGLTYESMAINDKGQLDEDSIGDLSNACLVLTAGTTATGAIDNLDLGKANNSKTMRAKWVHVDAAWAGPLRLSPVHKDLLSGIESADSVAISAHKWLFQPKDSAIILFKELGLANTAISMGSDYLAAPNVGIQGSRGAAAISLLATMLAWGEQGFSQRINRNMEMAKQLASFVSCHPHLELWQEPVTGVTVFAPVKSSVDALLQKLPDGMFSTCKIDHKCYLRSVAANPNADIKLILATLEKALQ